jgi:hypothetical protein
MRVLTPSFKVLPADVSRGDTLLGLAWGYSRKTVIIIRKRQCVAVYSLYTIKYHYTIGGCGLPPMARLTCESRLKTTLGGSAAETTKDRETVMAEAQVNTGA